MRKSGISLLLMLFAVTGWAQESKTEKKDSLPPIVIEGTLERVPEGTEIWIFERLGKSLTSGEIKEAKDSVRNGKFRIVFTPKDKNAEYSVMAKYGASLSRHSMNFYALPGSTTIMTGYGVHEGNWYARRNDWVNEDDDDYYSVKKKVKEADSLYVEYMTEFMQNREFSPVFEKYILQISRYILFSRNKAQREKAAKLLVKTPNVENRWDNEWIYEARRDLMPKFERIKIGEKLHDFVLYDHQDKEHHLTEFNDNGKYLLRIF